MTTPLWPGQVTKGKLILETPMRYLAYLSGLEGKRVELILRKQKSKRSDQQNRYYWGVVIEILANHCGYEAEEMHEALKIKFQWHLRYIMHKNLLSPCSIGPDVFRMDSKDIPGQINLLDRGFQGFHLSKLSDSFEIHYAKPT